jgi:beta-galactosidase
MLNSTSHRPGQKIQCSLWSDVIRLEGAQALATYEGDYYAGSPAITRNAFGNGTAFYVGTFPDQNGMDWLLERARRAAAIETVSHAPEGVELVRRTAGIQTWLFALNHSSEEVKVPLDQPGFDLLSQTKLEGSLHLGPMQVAIVQQPAR